MISKKDIMEAIGADTGEDRFITGMLVGIGVGAIVGGALAMLLAPKSGTELRQIIGERGADLYEKAKTKIGLAGNGGKLAENEVSPTGTTTR